MIDNYYGVSLVDTNKMGLSEISTELLEELESYESLEKQAFTVLSSALVHTWNMGKLLTKAKPLTGHGEWQIWIKDHCISTRNANRWMRTYQQYPDISKLEDQGSVKKALDAVTNPRPNPEMEETPSEVVVMSSSDIRKAKEEEAMQEMLAIKEENERLSKAKKSLESKIRVIEDQSEPHESQRVKEVQAANHRVEESEALANKNAMIAGDLESQVKSYKDQVRRVLKEKEVEENKSQKLQDKVVELSQIIKNVDNNDVGELAQDKDHLNNLLNEKDNKIKSLTMQLGKEKKRSEKASVRVSELEQDLRMSEKRVANLISASEEAGVQIPDVFSDEDLP